MWRVEWSLHVNTSDQPEASIINNAGVIHPYTKYTSVYYTRIIIITSHCVALNGVLFTHLHLLALALAWHGMAYKE